MTGPRGYEAIKQLAAELGRPIPDLLAMSRTKDPFVCGSPAQRQLAWLRSLSYAEIATLWLAVAPAIRLPAAAGHPTQALLAMLRAELRRREGLPP